jgi:hypothetical protein
MRSAKLTSFFLKPVALSAAAPFRLAGNRFRLCVNCPSELALYSLMERARSPFHAEPTQERMSWFKTVRIENQRCVTISRGRRSSKQRQTAVTRERTNFYATSFELGPVCDLNHNFAATKP